MKLKQTLVAVVLAAAIAAVWYTQFQANSNAKESTLSGNVDIREVNLSFRVGGRLKSLAVDEGAKVHAGDLLCELDAEPYHIALDDLTASNAALAARKALFRAGYRKEDIEQAKANLQAREAAQLYAERNNVRQLKLADTGASAQRLLDDARSQRDQAVAQTEAAREQLKALSIGYRREEVDEASANQEKASAQLRNARLQQADTRLFAPSDGTIITRAAEPGTMLAAGTTMLTLSLDRPVRIRAYVGEKDLGKIAPGMHAKIYTDSRPEPYDAVVGFISPTAEFTPKNVETQDLRTALVYRLRLTVENPDDVLRQGMAVTVKFSGKR